MIDKVRLAELIIEHTALVAEFEAMEDTTTPEALKLAGRIFSLQTDMKIHFQTPIPKFPKGGDVGVRKAAVGETDSEHIIYKEGAMERNSKLIEALKRHRIKPNK